MTNLTTFITPVWLLAIGTSVGLVVLLLLWGISWIGSRRTARAVTTAVSEGILLPVFYILLILFALAVLASPFMPTDRLLSSLQRLPEVGTTQVSVTVPARTTDFEVPLPFRAEELVSYSIESEQDVMVNPAAEEGRIQPLIQIEGGQLYRWTPGSPRGRGFEGDVDALYVTNESDLDSQLTATFSTEVEMPEVHHLKNAAISVIGLFAVYLLIWWLAPRVSIIATATAKEAISQPLFLLLTVIGVAALIFYIYVPYNTFGEDVKMLITSGMTTIKVLAIIVALWTASVSISDEIEGRTALTVLSKPIGRRQFIMGKFLGILWPILLMFIILGIVFLLTVSYKVVYDARESSKQAPMWQDCYVEMVRIIPGLVLSFYEAVVLAAVSVAISTRLSMIPNLVICGTVYVLGHLGPLIVRSAVGDNVFVQFIGKLIAVILPVLHHFEIEGAIAGASTVPAEYLLFTLLYSFLYCAAAMLLALIFFEERDLA